MMAFSGRREKGEVVCLCANDKLCLYFYYRSVVNRKKVNVQGRMKTESVLCTVLKRQAKYNFTTPSTASPAFWDKEKSQKSRLVHSTGSAVVGFGSHENLELYSTLNIIFGSSVHAQSPTYTHRFYRLHAPCSRENLQFVVPSQQISLPGTSCHKCF